MKAITLIGKRFINEYRLSLYFLIALIIVLLPIISPLYMLSIYSKILILAIFAMSIDLLVGYTGLFSLGQAIYFGLSAYTVALLVTQFNITNFFLVASICIIITILGAALTGLIALRMAGVYFLLITLALGYLFENLASKMHLFFLKDQFTIGYHGIVGIPRPDLGVSWFTWTTLNFYYFILGVFIACFILLYILVNSPFGLVLKGIRDNPQRMRAIGYNIWFYKYIVFVVSGAFAGIAGMLFVYFNGVAFPSFLGVMQSTTAIIMVIIGGAGTLTGPIIGAAMLVLVEYFSSIYLPDRWPLVLGCLFVLAVMFFRGGVITFLTRIWRKRFSKNGNIAG